uniref:SPIN-DOC-like zinc-finger domain-containing protein n=1 Tax=Amphilophus citrinellus TaxID=61819 RepID=A0A3Q0RPI0_AMPCI
MSLTGQKRKIDNENRGFNPAWTDQYVFILPQRLKPLCLICNESLSVLKEYNIRRHHVEKHRAFGTAFPEGTEERVTKVQIKTFTAQERATAASLRVSWNSAKKKRPFTDAETVRDCMIAILDEVIHDDKIKASVTSAVKSVPLSDTSNMRRVEILATDVFEALLSDLKKVETVNRIVCVSALPSTPQRSHYSGLDMTRVCMLVTDGAPSMTGKVSGLTAVAPRMTALHCIVHQAVLCAKLNGHFKNVMDDVMATVNFIRATSSLQHRLFRQLLSDMSPEHHDLLLHNDIRWLSKGNPLERFCALKEEIQVFLHDSKQKKAEAHLNRIMDTDFMADVCFLSDLFKHLNQLNLRLQGREKTIIDLVEQTRAFQAKLELFAADLSSGRMLHFPTLRKCITDTAPVTAAM